MAARTSSRKTSTPRKTAAAKKGSPRKKAAAKKSVTPKKPVARKTGTRKKSTTKKTSPRRSASAKKTVTRNAGAKKTSVRKKSTGRRKYSSSAAGDVGTEMREMKKGTLKSGHSGKKVTNRKQAIAIGLSKARRSGKKVPPNPNRSGGKKPS